MIQSKILWEITLERGTWLVQRKTNAKKEKLKVVVLFENAKPLMHPKYQ